MRTKTYTFFRFYFRFGFIFRCSRLTSLLYIEEILTCILFIIIILEIASMPSTGVQGNEVLSYIFGILAIVLNGVLLASMYKERKKIFVTRISSLVSNLAFADCLNGLFLIILSQPIKEIEYKSDARLLIELPLMWIAFCASILTIIVMAAERVIIVTLPMEWSTLLTIPRTLLCILAVSWLLSIGCGVAIHYRRYYVQFVICLINRGNQRSIPHYNPYLYCMDVTTQRNTPYGCQPKPVPGLPLSSNTSQ